MRLVSVGKSLHGEANNFQEHFLSRFDSMWFLYTQPTSLREQASPVVGVSFANVQCGVLDLYFGANLCPWLLLKETGVEVMATVVSCKCDDANVDITLYAKSIPLSLPRTHDSKET